MNANQLHVLRHSLGLDDNGNGREYRNHYCCDPESDLTSLCESGHMRDTGSSEMCGGMHIYQVTDLGKEYVHEKHPVPVKLSRSKRRYLNFLRADCGMRFGEWLKAGGM